MWKVYGSRVSYYTGKLEAYLRYKGIAYELLPTPYDRTADLVEKVGAVQMPIVERDDGRWMSDTTPILLHMENEIPEPSILPSDPLVRFMAILVEDYADEWLWRPAMHYRWSYAQDSHHIARVLTDEVLGFMKWPHWIKRWWIKKRQFTNFVIKDGITDTTRPHADQTYLNALDAMSAMLANRPFLFGDVPCLADFGMMGPMFRHFGQDPTPEEIMRNRAPLVYEWVARMWNARKHVDGVLLQELPTDAGGLLREVCETHLVQLAANAAAYARGERSFAATIQSCQYSDLPVSRYRVWCLEQLSKHFAALPADIQQQVRELLPYEGAGILWSGDIPASGFNEDDHLPFGRAINVYGQGTPP